MEQAHVRPEGLGDGVELLVGGHDADHPVPGFQQGVEDVVVSPRRPVGGDDVLRGKGFVEPAHPLPEGGRALNGPVGQAAGAELPQERVPVLPGEGEQLIQGNGIHTGFGDVEPRPLLPGVHPFLHGEGFDLHENSSLFSTPLKK